jgi:hypothetical protein
MRVLATAVLVVVIASLFLVGCEKDKETVTEFVNTGGVTPYTPKGTIHGVIRDICTNAAIAGAFLSVSHDGGVQTVVSDAAGQFSFANVPAGQFQVVPGGGTVFTGTYTVTASLVNYNNGQGNPENRYRNYYYNTVTITFTSLVPGDSLGVQGLVGSILFNIATLNTTVAGTIVDPDMQPVENALVTLFDLTVTPNVVIRQTQTNSAGEYRFTNVDNGISVMIRALSSDGNLQGQLPGAYGLPCNLLYDTLRSHVQMERIQITPVDNVAPYVIAITPENNADVSPSGLTVVYTFSEPIRQTAYTRTDLPRDHGTIVDDITFTYDGYKKGLAEIPFSAGWNTLFTQLTLTPQGIVGSGKYTVDATGAFTPGNIMDRSRVGIVNNANIVGDFEALKFTTAGGTPAPNPPVVIRRFVPGVFSSLNFAGGTVGLEWSFDPNVRSYNIYKSIDNGSFELVQDDFAGLQFTNNSGSLVRPSGVNDPLAAIQVRYHARAVSRDLVESAPSNVITVGDDVRPQMITAGVVAAPGTNNWYFTMQFSEPLALSGAQNVSNYDFSATSGVTFTKTAAYYLGFVGGTYRVQLSVTTNAALPSGFILTALQGVTDLAGNIMDPDVNRFTFP